MAKEEITKPDIFNADDVPVSHLRDQEHDGGSGVMPWLS